MAYLYISDALFRRCYIKASIDKRSFEQLRIDTIEDVETGLEALLQLDPRLQVIRDYAGQLPLRRNPAGFESLASIIVGQQVSIASAAAIWARFKQHIDPLTPENYLEQGAEVWKLTGLSRPKQKTFQHLSAALIEGQLDLPSLTTMPVDDAMAQLTAIHGIGPWTAEVYLLFAEGHVDIFPSGDVALQEAVARAFGFDSRPSAKELSLLAKDWSPWRGIAARLFWAYYAASRGKEAAPVMSVM